ncbi:hypothetical protein EYF80_024831 [Liparis tanakae]|uniref:Uncharacterized protein n=1 Tax=Liparis tanakae TaxID=230148 RepID=A0A4Z2HGF8_9TELE|nr:hypothetical protein EYF80_024831 [Liparis tanakae]
MYVPLQPKQKMPRIDARQTRCGGGGGLPEKSKLSQKGGVLLTPVRWQLGGLLMLDTQPLDFLQDFSVRRGTHQTFPTTDISPAGAASDIKPGAVLFKPRLRDRGPIKLRGAEDNCRAGR